jgi:hypothetical protein
MSPPDPSLRASDEDRDRVAAQLREHHAVGRLTSDEFTERLDAAFKAKTMGELDGLMRDLPRIDLYRLPDAPLTRQPVQAQPSRRGRGTGAWRAAAGSWFTVSLLCFVIWALSGFGYPWWLWVAAPWGVVLAGSYLATEAGRSGKRQIGQGPGPGQLPPGQGGGQ